MPPSDDRDPQAPTSDVERQAHRSAATPVPPPGEPTSNIADGTERRLDPKSIPAQRLASAISAAILCGLALVAVVVLAIAGPFGRIGGLLLASVWFAFAAGLGVFVVFWPPVRYRHTSYRVTEDGIRIRRGVVWRLAISVPRSRVQHTDVSRGPVERAFDLATLIIYTAGTQHASVHLSGLAHESALAIRDHLIASDDDDAV